MRLAAGAIFVASCLAWTSSQGQEPLVGCGTVGITPAAEWREILTADRPPARMHHSIAFDEARGVLVVFGGAESCVNRSPRNDTWEYDGENWVQVQTPVSPPPRYYGSLVFDSARERLVLYGGSTNGLTSYDDTWEYHGETWTQIAMDSSPGHCARKSMAYDPIRDRVVLRMQRDEHGDGQCDNPQQTWELDDDTWARVVTATEPPDTEHHNWHAPMFWDSVRGQLAYTLKDSLWTFDGSDWAQVDSASCGVLALGVEPVSGAYVATPFSGIDSPPREFDELAWWYPNQAMQWTNPFVYPAPRSLPPTPLVLNTQRGSLMMFGGFEYCSSTVLNDTWELIIDADQDSYADTLDCAPFEAAIYPNAPQLCDGLNNDCLDPGWPSLPISELDGDSDGFPGCAGDCDDTDPMLNPGAAEYCNGIDENCNGFADEGCLPNCEPRPEGLISWWSGNNTTLDVFGLNDGTPENGPSFAPGVVGSAFDLDGDQEFVRIPDSQTLSPSPLSLEVWINPRSLPVNNIMSVAVKGDYAYRIQLEGRSGFPAGITWALHCGTWIDVFTGMQPPLNAWTHIAGTYDGAIARVYINGSLAASGPAACLDSSPTDLAIGENLDFPNRANFDGLIDELRLYDRALSDAEVLAIYQSGGSGLCNCFDDDGDGYFSASGCGTLTDCNDGASGISPGAAEACNGLDDDCDTLVDEDATGEDSDADGVHNLCDVCPTVPDPGQADTDGDAWGDACDNCLHASNVDQANADGDPLGDACDNCPADFNTSQADTDNDHRGDVCDNCILTSNPGQEDFDQDNQGDVCDLDDGYIMVDIPSAASTEWQGEIGFDGYNAYRGSVAILRSTGVYTQTKQGGNRLSDRECGATTTTWAETPPLDPGEIAFYLATGELGGIESGLDADSSGVPRVNANPCQ